MADELVHVAQTHSPGDEPPAAGAPWDLPLAETPLAFLDLEMTGLRVGEDRVLEVCIERVRGDVLEGRIATLIDPGTRRGNEHVHGIDASALAGAPRFSDVATEVVELLSGAVVVAHAAGWDLAFLRDELARVACATDASPHASTHAPTHAIDTLVLARRVFHFPSYGLQSLARELSIHVARAHRAADDVATLRALWGRLVAALAPRTARDLWEIRVGDRDRATRAAVLRALEAALPVGRPVELVYRPSGRGAERLTVVLTALAPPHAIGYLLPGRSRRELRLDRILRVEPPSS